MATTNPLQFGYIIEVCTDAKMPVYVTDSSGKTSRFISNAYIINDNINDVNRFLKLFCNKSKNTDTIYKIIKITKTKAN